MRRGRDGERGAALVELGLAVPILVLLLFGIVDFGWLFTHELDVRHGAREGSRLVAVNYNPTGATSSSTQAAAIATEICRRMDGASGATVTLRIPSQPGTVGQVGQTAEVEVARPAESLTKMFEPLLGGRTHRSTVLGRLEVQATWATGYGVAITQECA